MARRFVPAVSFTLLMLAATAMAANLTSLRTPVAEVAHYDPNTLLTLMGRAADYLVDHHARLDDSQYYGMMYQFYKPVDPDGKHWWQDPGRDTIHNMGWVGNALVEAYRTTGDTKYSDILTDKVDPFLAPYITNSKARFGTPVDGMPVYWWDDGHSYSLHKDWFGQPMIGYWTDTDLSDGYKVNSNHMAQDLGMYLASSWQLTRDPAVATAMDLLWKERKDNLGDQSTGSMKVNGTPWFFLDAAIVNGDAATRQSVLNVQPTFSGPPTSRANYMQTFTEYKATLAQYSDEAHYGLQAWMMGQYNPANSEKYTAELIHTAATNQMLANVWMQDEFKWGVYGWLVKGSTTSGRLDEYASDSDDYLMVGMRGMQFSILAAYGLQMLQDYPNAYTLEYRTNHTAKPWVKFTDSPPVIDGNLDAASDYGAAIAFGTTNVRMVSDIRNLYMYVDAPSAGTTVTVNATASSGGKYGRLTVSSTGAVTMVNQSGQTMLTQSTVKNVNGRWVVEIQVPYTMATPATGSLVQVEWANGIEHCQYLVNAGGVNKTIYMMSDDVRMKRYLENMVNGTLNTWVQIWNQKGFIPPRFEWFSGGDSWAQMSDTQAYAWIMLLTSQYLNYLRGEQAWDKIWTTVLPESAIPGDVNCDNKVDFADFQTMQNHWNQLGQDFQGGDMNGDGKVDFADFQIMQNHWNMSQDAFGENYEGFGAAETLAIPEPASLTLLGLGAAALLARRKRQ